MMNDVYYINKNNERIELEDVSLIKDAENEEKFITFADILKADQRRIAKKYNLSTFNVFELLTLFAPVKSRIKGIKQKFRFNKIIFYIGKDIEKEYGKSVLEFDSIYSASAGPIPEHLTEDIISLRNKGLVNTWIEHNQKKILHSNENYEKLMREKAGSGIITLTKEGEDLSQKLWIEIEDNFGDEMLNLIEKIKGDLIYMDTEQLKNKVHAEYPEWQKKYTENDTESIYS